MASTYLQRTPSVVGNRKTFTLSTWIKRGNLGNSQYIFYGGPGSGNESGIRFDSSNKLEYFEFSGGYTVRILSSNNYRDVGAFYHIVLKVDTTQATASDRVKIYVNSSEITYGIATYPSQNSDSYYFNNTSLHTLGANSSPALYFDGLMSHFHWIDGTAYDASTFGETDATTGIWKPKTAPSVTYGTNGFFLKFENSGSMGTDSSPNGNNFTVNGNLTQTVDTPSNVFATFNPLKTSEGSNVRIPSFDLGNTRANFDNASYNESGYTTLAVSSGKWYCEMKAEDISANANTRIGIANIEYTGSSFQGDDTNTFTYQADGNKRVAGTATSYGNTYTTGDIIGIAIDLDNQKLYFSKNGTWQNSGDPTSGATGTGAISINSNINYSFYAEDYASSGNKEISANFGNGYFGTTAVSSATSDESGLGIFEYTVPSGYYALCTKNINEQG